MTPAADFRLLRHARFLLAGGLAALALFLVSEAEWREPMAEWRAGENLKLVELVRACAWWGSAAAAGILAVLLGSSRWWARPLAAVIPSGPAPAGKVPRWFWWTLLFITLAGGCLRAPRVGLSLYNDEAHAFRLHLSGMVPSKNLGDPSKFRQVTWLTTLYENKSSNNSMVFSALSRASYDTWRSWTGAAPGTVNEVALRLPVTVCGILSAAAMGLLGMRLAGPGAGMLAALLTALHPWHLRYSAEARNYGILLLVLPLLFLALHRALRAGTWRAWLVFGFMEYLTQATWLGAAHVLVSLNAGLAVWGAVWCFRKKPDRAGAVLVPALVAGLLAAALYLVANFPHFLQSVRFMNGVNILKLAYEAADGYTAEWFRDTGSHLLWGVPAAAGPPEDAALLSAAAWRAAHPVALVVSGITLGAAFLTGVWRALRGGGVAAVLAAAFLGGGLLTILQCDRQGLLLLTWYALFLLPGLLMLVTLGLKTAGASRIGRAAAGAGLLAVFAVWIPVDLAYQTRGRENIRGGVEIGREAPYPAALKNPRDTLFAVMWSEAPVYDNAAVTLRDDAHLRETIELARREGRALYVEHGFPAQARKTFPAVFALLDDPALFEKIAVLPGLDEVESAHSVYRLVK